MPPEGAQAPDFTLPGQDGQDVTVSGLRGRPVVLLLPQGRHAGVAEGVTRATTER